MNISKTRWSILKELSNGDRTPSQLSKKLKITMPSVHSQLRILEKEKMTMRKGKVKGKTRPYTEYSIGDGFICLVKVMPGITEEKLIGAKELRDFSMPTIKVSESGILTKEGILNKLERNRQAIRNFGVKKLYLIGSYARSEAKDNSDIYFLVEFQPSRGLFDDYSGLLQLLKDLFNREIDMVKPSLVREELKYSILGGGKIEARI